MKRGNWTIAEAKAKFSEVIEQARSHGPQTITRHGHDAAVIVALLRGGRVASDEALCFIRDVAAEA